MKINLLASLLYNLLITFWWAGEIKFLGRIWHSLWERSRRKINAPILSVMHGNIVAINYGYAYPYNARKHKRFNNPLVELIYQASLAHQRPITLVDIGAAVGDTALLALANCANFTRAIYCIEGDAEFFKYLQHNLKNQPNVRLLRAMLSDAPTAERELIKIHKGTASAQGRSEVQALPLDLLFADIAPPQLDVIKIDTDGFDGKIIKGAASLIEQDRPAIIFEWHPTLYEQTQNDWRQPFDVLSKRGYDAFLWFNKFGEFSHITCAIDMTSIETMAELCKRNLHQADWHYDIIALHRTSPISKLALAEMQFAKAKPSVY